MLYASEKQKAIVQDILKNSGFIDVRFSSIEKINPQKLDNWLEKRFHASMSWMLNHRELRVDPSKLLPHSKTVISLAHPYLSINYQSSHIQGISRYAQGSDYHNILRKKIKIAVRKIGKVISGFEARIAVDSAPVMEKYWAVKSGLGWQGKNSNIISKDFGSYFFLAELITTHEFPVDSPIADYCGSCTKCLDACPTDAIVDPYIVDSSKCISYLTIENKEIHWGDEFNDKTRDLLFGCDICQEVCPWNKFSIFTNDERFFPREYNILHSNFQWFMMSEEEFKIRFRGSAVLRAGYHLFLRNIEHATGKDDIRILKVANSVWTSYQKSLFDHKQSWKDIRGFYRWFEDWWSDNAHLLSKLWSNYRMLKLIIREINSILEQKIHTNLTESEIKEIIKKSCVSMSVFKEWMAAKWMITVKEVETFYNNIRPQNVLTAIWHIAIFNNDRRGSYFEQLLISPNYLSQFSNKDRLKSISKDAGKSEFKLIE